LNPDSIRWEQFWREMDAIGLWKWDAEYWNSSCDGTYWCLDFRFSGKSLTSNGKNAYPDGGNGNYSSDSAFAHFLSALEKLTGLKDIR
jgi:hypothetical protein